MRGLVMVAATVAAVSGCDGIFPPVCTKEALPALHIEVMDSTGAAIPAGTLIIATATDGTFTESETFGDHRRRVQLALERPGTYTIEITAEGYHAWRRESVRVVTAGDCRRIQTVAVVARLQPLPAAAVESDAGAALVRKQTVHTLSR